MALLVQKEAKEKGQSAREKLKGIVVSFWWGANFHYFGGGCASHEIFSPRMFPPTYRRMLIILFLRRNCEQTEESLSDTCPTVTLLLTIATASGSERLLAPLGTFCTSVGCPPEDILQ